MRKRGLLSKAWFMKPGIRVTSPFQRACWHETAYINSGLLARQAFEFIKSSKEWFQNARVPLPRLVYADTNSRDDSRDSRLPGVPSMEANPTARRLRLTKLPED